MKKNSTPSSAKKNGRQSTAKGNTLLIILLIAACLIVYGNSIGYNFTNWDDPVHVLENPDIKSLSAQNVLNMFSVNERYMYHPLTIISYAINYSFSGLSPGGYHFLNLLLHIGNALLFFYLLLFILKNNTPALIGALLFALHPLASEPVCWVSGRKDVLFALFFLASLLSYLKFTETKSKLLYAISLVLFIASMLSKPMAATFPLVLVLFDRYLNRHINFKTIIEKIPFAIVAVAIFLIPIVHKANAPTLPDSFSYSFTENYTLLNRILLSVNALLFYPFRFLFPYGLTAYHGFPALQNGSLPVQYLLTPVALLLFIFAIVKYRKAWKELWFGVLFYVITILPVIHLVPFGTNIYLAERYAYIPMLGLVFVFVTLILRFINQPVNRTKITSVSVAVILILSVVCINQNQTWKNTIALWNRNIEIYPNGFYGYFNRGNEFKKQNKASDALADYSTSIKYNSKFMEAFYNRGNVYSDLGNNQEAINDFTKAIELNPKYFVAYFNRGNSKAGLNNFNSAIEDYTLAIDLKPNYEEAYANRGNAKGMLKDYAGSIEDYNQSINLNPDNASAICNRALSKLNLNDKAGACADLQLAAQMGNEPAINLFNSSCK
ncbi:MAG TPA: tetratricopeptide repeat protein [Bacteroidia bacterium]|nr:tetratricopeptide repeat protein [Bacteroidia bacterium]HNU34791.1 tetratricopeptide repeat protein [Bacteroidia bacterium]